MKFLQTEKKRLYRKGTYFGSGDSAGKRLNQKQTF